MAFGAKKLGGRHPRTPRPRGSDEDHVQPMNPAPLLPQTVHVLDLSKSLKAQVPDGSLPPKLNGFLYRVVSAMQLAEERTCTLSLGPDGPAGTVFRLALDADKPCAFMDGFFGDEDLSGSYSADFCSESSLGSVSEVSDAEDVDVGESDGDEDDGEDEEV